MFERFTERARQAVILAQEEARALRHTHIGTEHILLGLLREHEGLAARVLASLEITLERVRAQVVAIVGAGEEGTAGQIPFTAEAKRVLELSLRESLSLGHNYIGTEHILLGLGRNTDTVAARILVEFGADPQAIRDQVTQLFSGAGATPLSVRRRPVGFTSAEAGPPLLPARQLSLVTQIALEIRERFGRPADEGDHMLALASQPGGLLDRALAELGVDAGALSETIERVRGAAPAPGQPVSDADALRLARARLGLHEPPGPAR